MSVTAPYDPRAAARLTFSARHVHHVYATGPDWPEAIGLDIVSGTITWDEDRSPHVTANLQTRVPDDTTLTLLDPRQAVKIEVFAGYQHGTRPDVQLLASLHLISRTRRAPSADLILTAGSSEYPLTRWSPLSESRTFGPGTGAGAAISQLIRWADPGADIDDQMTGAAWLTGDETQLVNASTDLWPVIADITDRAGAWTYHDGLGRWHIVPQPLEAGPSAVLVRPGPGGTLTGIEAALDATEWANVIVVTYKWRDGAGDHEATGWAQVTSGPYAVARVGRVAKRVTIERPGSVLTAQTSARNMLARSITRGERISIEAANAPYWLRPGDGISIQDTDGSQARYLVARLDIDIPTGTYHVTTRTPDIPVIETGV